MARGIFDMPEVYHPNTLNKTEVKIQLTSINYQLEILDKMAIPRLKEPINRVIRLVNETLEDMENF